MHVCTAFRPPVNSTKDTYVVMDFSACISTQFYNNISVNITMFNWQVGPRTLPPTSTDCGGNVCPAGQVLWMVLFLPSSSPSLANSSPLRYSFSTCP